MTKIRVKSEKYLHGPFCKQYANQVLVVFKIYANGDAVIKKAHYTEVCLEKHEYTILKELVCMDI